MLDHRRVAPRIVSTQSFAELLRHYRLAARLTQEELAERSAVSVRAISDLERGVKTRPQRETVRLLAAALGLTDTQRDQFLGSRSSAEPGSATEDTRLALGNLPAPPTPLVGRQESTTTIAARLRQSDVRLLTITGPGGVGKSRLALAVAELLQSDFPDGAFFVPLAALDEPALVAATIARVLSVAERGGQPVAEMLPAALRERQLLLVLDNFEHLLPAVEAVDTLLANCPGVRILATSRAVLGSSWEHEQPLAPLNVPASGENDLAVIAAVPAVALFVQRAAAIRPDFSLSVDNAPIIAAICRRLDGLPLAIELAAARLRLLPPATILERLNAPLRLLAGASLALPMRQRTMRTAIAWSYDLLPPEQAVAFRRFAVFAGGGTLAAAEAVCAAGDLAADQVFDAIGALVDHSLLQAMAKPTADDISPTDFVESRLSMLEVVREFGLELLQASGEEKATRQRHATYFLALAEEAAPALIGSTQAPWLARLEQDHENLRIALSWAIENAEADMALRLASSLTDFWRIRGYFREGRSWLERALVAGTTPTVALAEALLGAGTLAWRQGDLAAAATRLEESLALARELGADRVAAGALHYLGIVVSHGGDLARAQALNEESLALRRTLGDRRGMAAALNSLGELARRRDDLAQAEKFYSEGLELYRAVGYTYGHAVVLHNLGEVALALGQYQQAASYFRESLTLHRRLGNTYSIAYQIAGLAGVAALSGEPKNTEHAARLFGAANGIFAATGALMDPADRPNYERAMATVLTALGEPVFTAAFAAGHALNLDNAIAEALSYTA